MGFFEKIFGTYSSRELKKIAPIVDKICALEEEYRALTDEELKAKTPAFRERLKNGETLDDLLPEAFATVREAADRVLGMRHFVCQLYGGVILHQGRIAEMKTGEGKTMVATLPTYLNALTGNGVHIVTVNDYLARRDSEWMGKLHQFLGLSVGLVVHGQTHQEKKNAYLCDVTYGTNNEFGFDYLRDNMVQYREQMVQRPLSFAIVDEVDSILIDEARTPLIISGRGEKSDDMYARADAFAKRLRPLVLKEMESKEDYTDADADYIIDEKNKTAVLTAKGEEKAEREFGVDNLADYENVELQHYLNQAIRAHGIMHCDVDYVVKDGEVIIIDEFTGRMMFGRRFSNGLHQAIEAKEGLDIKNENKTLATITFQNYFRLYDKLSGMTGTALTEEGEFREIYSLDVIEVPTNKPMIRKDANDLIYKTQAGKYACVIERIKECHQKGQPVLVGTITIEKSEMLSQMLKREGIPHKVLNAKHHEKEAAIVAQAGKFGAVTIATNMAGRGTDIILGGNAEFMAKNDMEKEGFSPELLVECTGHADTSDPEILAARERFAQLNEKYKAQVAEEAVRVKEAGGLFILGTERHESRRIDNQLRGRAGRQGDVGESVFYLSLEDDLMRLFGGERVAAIADRLNLPEDQPIEAGIISGQIENAQQKIESSNFARRKRVLEYDDVINQQRTIIYRQRRQVLDGDDLKPTVEKMIDDVVTAAYERFVATPEPEGWDLDSLRGMFRGYFLTDNDLHYEDQDINSLRRETVLEELKEKAFAAYAESERINTPEKMREIERAVVLSTVDSNWMDHIDAMDDLRQGISLQAYGQRDPVIEYKRESGEIFDGMIDNIKEEVVKKVMIVRLKTEEQIRREQQARITEAALAGAEGKKKPVVTAKSQKVGRNDPCPCGSGKKYKHCCGKQ